MALLVGYPFSDPAFGAPFSNYYFWATVGTLLIIVVYIMVCLGGIRFFWQTRDSRRWNPIVHVVVPVVGAVVFAAAVVRLGAPDPARHPQVDAVRWPWSGWSSASGCCSGCGRGGPQSVAHDRLHPRRGGRRGRGRPGQVTRTRAACWPGRLRPPGPGGAARMAAVPVADRLSRWLFVRASRKRAGGCGLLVIQAQVAVCPAVACLLVDPSGVGLPRGLLGGAQRGTDLRP